MSAISRLRERTIALLRWTERYTKTDMVYLASGTFWSNLNIGVISALAFAASLIFAHFLSKEEYGNYQYVLSIAGLIGATTLNYMNGAVNRAVARGHEGEIKHSVRFQLIAGVIPLILGLGVALWYFLHNNTELTLAFICVAIFLPLGNAFNTWSSLTGGRKMFRVGTYYSLVNSVIAYAGILLATYFGRSFLWVIFGNYIFGFVGNYLMYRLTLRNLKPNSERDPETIRYGVHLSLMALPATIASQFDSLLVFHFVGAAELAVYSFATIIPEKLSGILKFLPNLAFPKLAQKDDSGLRLFLTKKLWIIVLICCVMAGGYAVFAPYFYHFFFPQYNDSIPFTQVYSLSFFSLVVSTVQTALMSQKKTRELYAISFVMPLTRIILMAVLMYFYSIWGLLWAQILNNFIFIGFQLSLVYWRKPAPTPLAS